MEEDKKNTGTHFFHNNVILFVTTIMILRKELFIYV